jgi:plasmid maintenance system antidote protein VapI
MSTPTHEDLRGEIAKRAVVKYRLAGCIGVHPSRLSQYLNGHVPLPQAVALRIQEALGNPDLTRAARRGQ